MKRPAKRPEIRTLNRRIHAFNGAGEPLDDTALKRVWGGLCNPLVQCGSDGLGLPFCFTHSCACFGESGA